MKRVFSGLLFVLLFNMSCDGDDTAAPPPPTGDEDLDQVVLSISEGEEAAIRAAFAKELALPCVSPEETGQPKCNDGESTGTIVRAVNHANCQGQPNRLEESDFTRTKGWELYAVESREGRGYTHHVLFSPGGDGDEEGLAVVVRTYTDVFAEITDRTAKAEIWEWSYTCGPISEALGSGSFGPFDEVRVPPPEQR